MCSLLIAGALAAPDHSGHHSGLRRGRRGRLVAHGRGSGHALRNGATIRKVVRKAKSNQRLTPPLAFSAPAAQPAVFGFRTAAAPVTHIHHNVAPAIIQPAAPIQFARAPLQPLPPPPAPLPVAFVSAPAAPAIAPAFVRTAPVTAAPVQVSAVRSTVAQPTLEYGPPATVAPEVRAPTQEYGLPAQEVVEVKTGYLGPQQEVVEVRQGYLGPQAEEEEVVAVKSDYGPPVAEPVTQVRTDYRAAVAPPKPVAQIRTNYAAAVPEVVAVRTDYAAADAPVEEEEVVAVRSDYAAAAVEEPEVVAVRTDYLAAEPAQVVAVKAQPEYNTRSSTSNVKSNTVRAKPIALVRSSANHPAESPEFDYSFESENGIKQEAVGSVRLVDDVEVSVMKGSYSFVGADGVEYVVDWYADETGFHASGPHLPVSVEPNHPEVAAAVRAQIAFAAEEDAARAAASRTSSSYAAPEERLASYN